MNYKKELLRSLWVETRGYLSQSWFGFRLNQHVARYLSYSLEGDGTEEAKLACVPGVLMTKALTLGRVLLSNQDNELEITCGNYRSRVRLGLRPCTFPAGFQSCGNGLHICQFSELGLW